jgi:hypothetical protein
MSEKFEPPGSRLENVEVVISLVDSGERRIDGQAGADILAEYHKLVAQGLEGWRLINALLAMIGDRRRSMCGFSSTANW